MNHSSRETSRNSSQSRSLLSTTFQYSRTTAWTHHSVSTFQRAMGSTGPDHEPVMYAGVPSAFSVTAIGMGGLLRRVMRSAGGEWGRMGALGRAGERPHRGGGAATARRDG